MQTAMSFHVRNRSVFWNYDGNRDAEAIDKAGLPRFGLACNLACLFFLKN